MYVVATNHINGVVHYNAIKTNKRKYTELSKLARSMALNSTPTQYTECIYAMTNEDWDMMGCPTEGRKLWGTC